MFLNINAWLSIKIWLDSESCHPTWLCKMEQHKSQKVGYFRHRSADSLGAVKTSTCKKCEYKFNVSCTVSIHFVFLALLLKKL